MDLQKKEKILKGAGIIPTPSLVKYITGGEVSSTEIYSALSSISREDKIEEIKKALVSFDNALWTSVQNAGTADAVMDYLNRLPDGIHAAECGELLDSFDDKAWNEARATGTAESLGNYLNSYPGGKHIAECQQLLNDLPWLEATTTDTIEAYQAYMARYPGQHSAEINDAINRLSDESDWEVAVADNTSYSLGNYLNQHPYGVHATEARMMIQNLENREMVLEQLRSGRNAFEVDEIKRMVSAGQITWDELSFCFSEDEIMAIREYESPTELPDGQAPDRLQKDSTEVYFWGTPSSGKTCALGAILSAANRYGIITKKQCQGKNYMDLLSNIFTNRGFCVFPHGTPDFSIQELIFHLRDNRDNEHRITCIDLAGEVFRALYKKMNNIEDDSFVREQALNKTLSYLNDRHNKKIHFFIVAYGEEFKKWDGLNMSDYLDTAAEYLNTNNIIRKGTNGVYILVTKSDMMPCEPDQRAEFADEYVRDNMPAFYNNLRAICRKCGISDFEVIPFSVGDVFAQKLCRFESDNTDAVLNKLILKSPAIKSGLLRW